MSNNRIKNTEHILELNKTIRDLQAELDRLQKELIEKNKIIERIKHWIEDNEVYNGIEFVLNREKEITTKEILKELEE